MTTLRTTVDIILGKMLAAGHDVYDNCRDWTDDEVYSFYCNYADQYCK